MVKQENVCQESVHQRYVSKEAHRGGLVVLVCNSQACEVQGRHDTSQHEVIVLAQIVRKNGGQAGGENPTEEKADRENSCSD